MKKNEIYTIRITDLDQDGNGIGHLETGDTRRMAVFVKDTIPGDTARIRIVKVTKKLTFGRLEEIITPSPDRVEPLCPKARACGGCTLQHIRYDAQLQWKQGKVAECLKRIGGIEDPERLMEPITGMEEPWHFRNKMQFPVGMVRADIAQKTDAQIAENKVPALGFYACRTHALVPLSDCAVGHPVNETILSVVRQWIIDYDIPVYDEASHTGLLRHVLTRVGFTSRELMVCLVINGRKVPHADALLERLQQSDLKGLTLISFMANINREKTNRILGDRSIVLAGQSYITDSIGNLSFRISPQSFYQVNPVQTRIIYEKALEYAALTGNETVWDMYCGTGTISLFLAQKARQVYGVEIIPEAIRDARENAARGGVANAEFFVGKAEEVVPDWVNAHDTAIDVVVVDPPRKGCDPVLLDTLIRMQPKRIVYVSCDPATLARDVKILGEQGYGLQKAAVFDAFCHSGHCETVACLEQKE